MVVKPLNTIPFQDIIDCFNKSFEGYFVKMPTDANYFKQRWEAANVDYSLSFGAFINNQLVGFIIHAIDTRNNNLTAYNTGTGVIPEFRGQQIVNKIYQTAIPILKEKGITRCSLEVIKENTKAIKAYQNVGFNICKNYKCFNGEIALLDNENIELLEIDDKQYLWKENARYSWDNQRKSVLKTNYKYYNALQENQTIGSFIINLDNGYIPQFYTNQTDLSNWKLLFQAIKKVSSSIKINNVDETLVSKIDILNHIGLNNSVDQYEMELFI